MPSPPLFRPQAMAHASVTQYGNIVILQPRILTWLTGIFGVLALCIILFFCFASYTRKEQVNGVLMPRQGLIRLQPLQPGMVISVKVKEGQRVSAGDVLFVLANERTSATRGDTASAISALLQARRDSLQNETGLLHHQMEQKINAQQRRLRDLGSEIQRIDEQIMLQKGRIKLAEQAVERNHTLLSSHFISAAALQDKQAELIDQQAKLADLQRAKASTENDRDTAVQDLNDLRFQIRRDEAAAQRNVDAAEQDLTENEAKRTTLIRAPQAGIVSGIATQAGQTVSSGMSLANLSPIDSPLEAELYAPSRAAGFAKPGQIVQIRYQAYPFEKFGQFQGEIREVSHSPLTKDELPMGTNATEPLYRIRVRLQNQSVNTYGQPQALKAGMALDASVLLERRKLYEWVLEPLFSISGKV
ncbi:HlyD family efflux transporter periplasmic adaptor subunit [Chromobacterium paludis]|uniref:HlyD family efflux transporter periplasmic adaptor subunit n=2 Tax=Chromobacterium paludis TaxID=2605945 RepID=A0A5C1DMP6_9NEIS|nr:HlyD family efflux transporter periplasmic adaptor subunit [Chromobacterium paludis]